MDYISTGLHINVVGVLSHFFGRLGRNTHILAGTNKRGYRQRGGERKARVQTHKGHQAAHRYTIDGREKERERRENRKTERERHRERERERKKERKRALRKKEEDENEIMREQEKRRDRREVDKEREG